MTIVKRRELGRAVEHFWKKVISLFVEVLENQGCMSNLGL
jgi:hypothetical protein